MEIVVNLFLVRSRDCWIGIGLAWSLSMRDWLLIGRLLWIGCVTCVQFILRRDTSVSPYSRLVPWLLGQLSPSDWHTIDTGLKLDWQIGCRPESSWLRIVLVPLTKWGFVTRIGLVLALPLPIECQWEWFECRLFVQLGELFMMHWLIGHGLVKDWWIGQLLFWWIGAGLDWHWTVWFAMDRPMMCGLVMDWQMGMDWI